MTGERHDAVRILGSVSTADGAGAVRITDRLDAPVDDVWAALTDPARLAVWYGAVQGDLRAGGEYRARVLASEWDGGGRIEACEPARRLVVTGKQTDESHENLTEVTLTADGDQTILNVHQRGLPLDYAAAYGAGMQIHVEDLAAYLGGRERCDASARIGELLPAYRKLPVA